MNKFFKFISVSALFLSLTSGAWMTSHAAEINMPGFTGTANTTFTSGFSARVQSQDCRLLAGWNYTVGQNHTTLLGEGTVSGVSTRTAMLGYMTGTRGLSAADATTLLKVIDGSGQGCGQATKDNYGNTTDTLFSYGNDNATDGPLNFQRGDIFDATQSLYSEISGVTDNGTSLNLSFVASVNPALDINAPQFKTFEAPAKDDFESAIDVLDAYAVTSFDVADSFVDVQFGRYVTSWGESTFIPIGLNGFVTNALDLPKLLSPSSSIKEALIPTEQVTITTALSDGSTLEGYYQFNHEQVKLGPKGSYFGSEIFGDGFGQLDASGTNDLERNSPSACPYSMVGGSSNTSLALAATGGLFTAGGGHACTAANIAAYSRHATNWSDYDATSFIVAGLKALDATAVTQAMGTGANHAFLGAAGTAGASASNSGDSEDSAGNIAAASSVAKAMTGYSNLFTPDYRKGSVVSIFANPDGKFKDPDGSDYGLRWGKYFDTIGTGVDFGMYYANYTSKVPYFQAVMPNGVFAQDVLGAIAFSYADWTAGDLSALGVSSNSAGTFDTSSTASVNTGFENLFKGMNDIAFAQGLCDIVLGAARANYGYDGTNTRSPVDRAVQQVLHGVVIDNEIVHDSSLCAATNLSNGATALGGSALYGIRLASALVPMNATTYRAIFPEDNQVLGLSFNTNVNGTTLQGELAYRPDFPLATGASDQLNQIFDKNGATDLLNMFAVAGIDVSGTSGSGSAGLASFISVVESTLAATSSSLGTDFFDAIDAYERSSLGNVVDDNGNTISSLAAYSGNWYYSKPFIEYDVLSGTLGTTTAFTATHPVTAALGADSSALVTEVGFVSVMDMDDNANGYLARNGFNEGVAASTNKCLGAFESIASVIAANATPAIAALAAGYTNLHTSTRSLTNIGSGLVDGLFGNGGYCGDKPGADDFAATYRLLGTATYQNFNNSPWTLSPTVVISHDFYGFAPSSIGGFAEDRLSFSASVSFSKGDMNITGSYVDFMDLGDKYVQSLEDQDYLSLSISQSF